MQFKRFYIIQISSPKFTPLLFPANVKIPTHTHKKEEQT